MTPRYPKFSGQHDETTPVGNITNMDPKKEAIQHEKSIPNGDPDFKLVAAPFEEKTEEEKKLVRKIDLYLMPTIWVLYCFSYMVDLEENIVHNSS
jgi:hypothetical protein